MDPRVIGHIKTVVQIAGLLLGPEAAPGLIALFAQQYGLPADVVAELNAGYDELLAVQRKARARRAEIAAAGE